MLINSDQGMLTKKYQKQKGGIVSRYARVPGVIIVLLMGKCSVKIRSAERDI